MNPIHTQLQNCISEVSAKIENDKGEYVQAKAHLKVLKGDKSKVNIQGSENPVVTKQPYPFHIPYLTATICT